jgi:hypothetical protein
MNPGLVSRISGYTPGPTDLELLLPIPTLDGRELAGFREELARQSMSAEIVANDQGSSSA